MLAMSAIPVIVLIVAVTYSVAAQALSARTSAEVDRTNAVRRTLTEIREDLATAESNVRGFVLTERPAMQGSYEDAVRELERDIDTLGLLIGDRVQASRLTRLRELVDDRIQTFERVLSIGTARDPGSQDRLEAALLHGQTITLALGGLTDAMRSTADEAAAERIAARDAAARRAYIVQVVALPAAVLAAIVLLVAFAAGVMRRIAAMRLNARRLDEGEPLEAPDAARDELGSLSRAL